jgi:hypothetical protein
VKAFAHPLDFGARAARVEGPDALFEENTSLGPIPRVDWRCEDSFRMERVLHRANSLGRIRRGIQAGFDRLEVDLRYRHGRFLLCHDVPLGPWALGRSGAEFSAIPHLLIHWDSPFVRLPALLESDIPPLFIDLKGWWSDGALSRLMRLLGQARRDQDIVGSKKWGLLDRCKAVAPERSLVYAVGSNELPRLMKQMNGGDVPFGVSVDASMLEGSDHLAARLLDAKLAVYAWNLQSKDELSVLKDAGVAGAIFDEAAWA